MNIRPCTHVAQYYETDAMGIIHHSNYIRWFEEARVDFMDQMGYSYRKAEETGMAFAVLSVACTYHAMVRFGDTVRIRCAIAALTGSRMTVVYRVEDAADGTLRTTGESRHCFLGGGGRPVSLKKAIPELYGLFAEACAQAPDWARNPEQA